MGIFGKGRLNKEQQVDLKRLMDLINQNPKQEELNMAKTINQTAAAKATEKEVVATEVKETPVQASTAPVVAEATAVPAAPKAPTKSDLIRVLFTNGMSVAEIAKQTNSHYSFVYGVCRALKGSSPSEDRGPSRSDEIRALADAGHNPGEIAKALNANYSFVHSVVKKHREAGIVE